MNRVVYAIGLSALLLSGCFTGKSRGLSVDSESSPVQIHRTLTMEQMRDAIVRGGRARDWLVKSETPGCITLVLSIRADKHTVTVDVPYDTTSFSVKYVDSKNMDFDPATRTIRKKYIQWVRNLKQEIIRAQVQ